MHDNHQAYIHGGWPPRPEVIPNMSTQSIHCQLRSCSESSYGSDSESRPSSWQSGSGSDSDASDGMVDLTYERLVSLQSKPQNKGNVYAKSGGSQRRIKNALRHPVCQCACRLPFKILLKLCLAFWGLVKSDQDSLLWSLQHESGKKKRKQWFLQGQVSYLVSNTWFPQ